MKLTKNDISTFSGILLMTIIRRYFARCVYCVGTLSGLELQWTTDS